MEATGTFTVKMEPLTTEELPGIARFSLAKSFEGDLQGSSTGAMLTAGDPAKGAAGYIAMENVTGTLHGKRGSFVLQHSSTMNAGSFDQTIVVSPGTGTGDLVGLAGRFVIHSADHSYTFTYELGR